MSRTATPEWATEKSKRRSMRVLLSVLVTACGNTVDKKPFEEATKTLVVNAHGALILLGNSVARSQVLTVTNNATKQKLTCRVAYLGPTQSGRTQVGIEFTEPSPGFWQINFPPEDWRTLAS
jgi:hypothetical protein